MPQAAPGAPCGSLSCKPRPGEGAVLLSGLTSAMESTFHGQTESTQQRQSRHTLQSPRYRVWWAAWLRVRVDVAQMAVLAAVRTAPWFAISSKGFQEGAGAGRAGFD